LRLQHQEIGETIQQGPSNPTHTTTAKASEQGTIAITNSDNGHQRHAHNNNNATMEIPIGLAQEWQDTPNKDAPMATGVTDNIPNTTILVGNTISTKTGLLHISPPT
jgi:hypothetical protein